MYKGYDKEIDHVAGSIIRQTLPATTIKHTTEFLNDDNDHDPSVLGPYDPNLTCQRCGIRYHYGEIQKLRRHVNEFCISLKINNHRTMIVYIYIISIIIIIDKYFCFCKILFLGS